MPETFSAGSTVQYRRNYADYPADEGWALTLYLAGASTLSKAATADGQGFIVALIAAETAGLTPGMYRWLERASKGEEVRDADNDVVTVTLDLATASDGDGQTHNERMLAAIEARLENRVPADRETFQIFQTMVQKIPIEQLEGMRSRYQARVFQERNPDQFSRTHLVHFDRVGDE